MSQGFAPSASNQMMSANVLGRNPNTYNNYMQFQDSGRLANIQQNTPTMPQQATQFANMNMAGIQASPPYAQVPQINPYAAPQGMMPTGLASLPNAGQYGKGIV
tara:strand:- start:2051 stop:2362 length:312 start_codon:yes stop_codon:yes gene_type:complete